MDSDLSRTLGISLTHCTMKPLKSTSRGSRFLRFIWNGSPVMMLLSDAASSTNVPVSFSSVIITDACISDVSMKSLPKFFSGMEVQSPGPQRLRSRVQSVPLPLLPEGE